MLFGGLIFFFYSKGTVVSEAVNWGDIRLLLQGLLLLHGQRSQEGELPGVPEKGVFD